MATRSTIAVQLSDGSVKQVYCHWDGYVSHNGKLLHANYNTQEKAENLISHGSISSLGEAIGTKHNFNAPEDDFPGQCTFYHRDRGEDLVVDSYADIESFCKQMRKEEYNYLMKDGVWYLVGGGFDLKPIAKYFGV